VLGELEEGGGRREGGSFNALQGVGPVSGIAQGGIFRRRVPSLLPLFAIPPSFLLCRDRRREGGREGGIRVQRSSVRPHHDDARVGEFFLHQGGKPREGSPVLRFAQLQCPRSYVAKAGEKGGARRRGGREGGWGGGRGRSPPCPEARHPQACLRSRARELGRGGWKRRRRDEMVFAPSLVASQCRVAQLFDGGRAGQH
jgi:hypothetical protein